MKILVMHLSDIHFKSHSDPIMARARVIAATATSRIHSASAIFIVLSGDIAFSGLRTEYEAASAFLEDLKTALVEETESPVHFILAPGNHDCDLSGDQSVREALIESVVKGGIVNPSAAIVRECTKVQQCFTEFRNAWGPDEKSLDEALWVSYPFEIEGYLISFDCLNVSWMSQLHEKQGQLVFPIEPFEHLKTERTHLRIAVLHHPLNWYGQNSYKPFRKFIRSLAQIVITGHEHEQNVGENLDAESEHSAYIEGGVLQADNSRTPPSFNLIELDLSEDHYSSELHIWTGSIFEPQETAAWQNYRPLPHKKNNELTLTNEFSKKLDDPGGAFVHPGKQDLCLSDIYVYPDLRPNEEELSKLKNTVSSGVFRDPALLTTGILIKGDEKAGRTSLIYQLFRHFYDNGFAPLVLRGSDLKPSSKELIQVVERAVLFQYGKVSLSQFKQTPTVKKILFIDDFDAQKYTNIQRSEILQLLRPEFGGLLITVSDLFEIDEIISEGSITSLVGFREYELLEFGFKLRFELIRKWTSLGNGSGRDNAAVVSALDQTEKALTALVGRNLVPRVPIYLLTLLQSLELGQSSELQNSAYGDCYRFLITGALTRAGVKPIELKEYVEFCSYLSWEFCRLKARELGEAVLLKFNNWFSNTYYRRDFRQRFDLLIECRIIEQQGEHYSFHYQYSYYYFLGKYLSDNLQEKAEVRELVEQCCNHLYVRDYANTILFLAHHSRAPFIYERIVEVLKGLFADKVELDFKIDTNVLSDLVTSAPKLIFNDGDVIDHRSEVAVIRDELSASEEKNEGEQSVKVEEGGLSLVSKLTLLFKTIEILGQILKNQYATISNPEKEKLLDQIFKGPLRALKDFFDYLAADSDGLVTEIDRFIAEHDSAITDEKRKQLARDAAFWLVGAVSFGSLYKTAASVGSEHLRESISAVVESNNSDAYRLIELAVKLEGQGSIPYPLIKDLTKRTEGNAFSRHILKMFVLNYLYMFNTKIADKQKLCAELDIPMARQRLIDLKSKNAKRNK
jgi:hypothetical protein